MVLPAAEGGFLLKGASGIVQDCCCQECPTGYEAGDPCYGCFEAGETPTWLQVTFSDVYKCSGEALWTNLNGYVFCIEHVDAGYCTWQGSFTIDGIDIEVGVMLDAGATSVIYIKTDDANEDEYFVGESGTNCGYSASNEHALADCGNLGYFGIGDVVGYGGTAQVVNPNV